LTGCGPDQGGVCAVGVVAVGVSPGVDEVRVGDGGATDHRRFRLEVALRSRSYVVLVATKQVGEEDLSSICVSRSSRGKTCRWIGHRVSGGVRIMVGIVAVAGGLEGGDFRLGGGGGTVTANCTRGTEGKASEDADDGDDSEELDEGERRRRAARG